MTNRQKLLLALGAIGLTVAVVCCAASVVLVKWWLRPSPADVVDDYLTAVRDKDNAAVAELSCRSWPTGVFDRISTAFEVVDWDITDTDKHERSADVYARVTYRVLGFARSGEMVFTVVKEDDDWRVCGLNPKRS